MVESRKERRQKRKKKVFEYCLYCGVNKIKKGSIFCSDACEKHQEEYEHWAKHEGRKYFPEERR